MKRAELGFIAILTYLLDPPEASTTAIAITLSSDSSPCLFNGGNPAQKADHKILIYVFALKAMCKALQLFHILHMHSSLLNIYE